MTFPVWRTTLEVFEFLWRERQALVRFGLLPMTILSILGIIGYFAADQGEWQQITASVITGLAQALILLPVTVLWYRLSIIGETEISDHPLFSFGKREWRLLGWQFLVGLIILAVAFACAIVSFVLNGLNEELESFALLALNIVWTIGWLVSLLLLLTRLSMVMVLAALDQPVSLGAAWRMTRGVSGRLLASTILIVLGALSIWGVFSLIGFIASILTAAATGGSLRVFLKMLEIIGRNASNLISLLGMATLFGFVYKMLMAQVIKPPAPSLA